MCDLISYHDDLSEFNDPEIAPSDFAFSYIYSLVETDCIAYNERLAAAFGKLVTAYLEQLDAQATPSTLQLMVGSDPHRGPRTNLYTFSPTESGREHAIWNQRASWIVNKLVSDPDINVAMGTRNPIDAIFYIEAALFMMGPNRAALLFIAA